MQDTAPRVFSGLRLLPKLTLGRMGLTVQLTNDPFKDPYVAPKATIHMTTGAGGASHVNRSATLRSVFVRSALRSSELYSGLKPTDTSRSGDLLPWDP